MNKLVGLISRIQYFSTGDGPGIRTTVFFQGCNLRCQWCHNPETIPTHPVLLYYDNRCVNCGLCTTVCPTGAHTFQEGQHYFNRSLCRTSGACVDICMNGALELSGKWMTVDEVAEMVAQDEDFYKESGGGVTLSGGEPLLQPKFCAAFASECKRRGIHVLLDTAGNVDYTHFETVLPYIDEVYLDLKGADESRVREATGSSLTLVYSNLKRLIAAKVPVRVRVPIIPGHNDTPQDAEKMAMLIREAGTQAVDLLPFHRLGSGKYRALGQKYSYESTLPPDKNTMEALRLTFLANGIEVKIER